MTKELIDIPFVVVGEVSKEFEYLKRESSTGMSNGWDLDLVKD